MIKEIVCVVATGCLIGLAAFVAFLYFVAWYCGDFCKINSWVGLL